MNVLKKFAALVAASVAGVAVAQAQDHNVTQTSAIGSPYEARVAEGHHAPVAPPPIAGHHDAGCGYDLGACQPCLTACGPVCQIQSGFYAGFELVFIQPRPTVGNNVALAIDPAGVGVFNLTPFNFDFEMTPRIWFGYTGEDGLGARIRYWQFDHNANPVRFLDPVGGLVLDPFGVLGPTVAGETALAQYGLEMHVADFELTNQFCAWHSLITLSAGLRYVDMRQHTSIQYIDAANVTQVGADLSQTFRGIGPTLSAEVLRPIGDSGLALYTNARGSIVFGESDENLRFGVAVPVLGLNVVGPVATNARNSLAIAELGIGLQYGMEGFFARIGWEGQYWHNAGGPLGAGAVLGTPGGDIALQGLSIGAGFNY